MSFFVDREMIVSGFAIGVVSIVIGGIILFTHDTSMDQFYAYALASAGVVLLFASSIARQSPRNGFLLRLLLASFALLLLLGFLLKDVIERFY
jgi:hypothetical protein